MKKRIIVWVVLLLIAVGYIVSNESESKVIENKKSQELADNNSISDSVHKETADESYASEGDTSLEEKKANGEENKVTVLELVISALLVILLFSPFIIPLIMIIMCKEGPDDAFGN